MADDTAAPASPDVVNDVEQSTRSDKSVDETATSDHKVTEENAEATNGTDKVTDEAAADTAAENGDAGEDNATEEPKVDEPTTPAPNKTTNGTPATKGTNNRRKSGAGVPEHKKKTPAGKKKKAAPTLRLNVEPGDMHMVTMRGHPPWPVIVCDEDMLPESLLSKRPVSAKRIDGTYREDFLEGGKSAKDRRYPIMFLGTNEFAWQVNTDLSDFDLDAVKEEVAKGNDSKKKTKKLWEAYEEAAEGHDLAYYKSMLLDHAQAMQEEEVKQAVEPKKKDKAAKRKSIAADDSDDVEMEDADDSTTPAKKAKGSKKRKKDEGDEGENDKPAKTPKTKLKLNNKPKEGSAVKKEAKSKKAKAKASESDEADSTPAEEKPMTEAERTEKREKSVLYLRHRLQKGFLSRDQAPKENEMTDMSTYLKQLEDFTDLEAEVLRKTKVHKVLKAIIKLQSIPRDEEFQFKKRSNSLLSKWNAVLAPEAEASEEKPSAAPAAATEDAKTSEPPADGDGDLTMVDAKDESPEVKPEAAEPVETEAA